MWKLSKKSNRQKSSLKTKKKTGFTLIEILLVVTIIGILSGLSLPFYSRLILQNTISDTAENLVRSLRKAQIYTIAGKDGSDWAVNYSNAQIKLIRQSTGTVFDIYNVSDSVTISSLSQVVFSRPSGQPDITGTFNVSDGNDTKAVTLNSEGVAGVSN